jgi:tRNA 2-thiouridine synthesizing protein A
MNFDKELDARGLNCPLPILRTKKALVEIGAGQVLKVAATDSGSV